MLLHPLSLKLYFRGLKTSLSHFLDACYEDKQTYVALSSYSDAQMRPVIPEILTMTWKTRPTEKKSHVPSPLQKRGRDVSGVYYCTQQKI